MTLYLIGLGLGNEKDITIKGLETIKKCRLVYLEKYTSKLGVGHEELEKFYGKKIIPASRALIEKGAEKEIFMHAKDQEVALLIIGDPMAATTHSDILLRAYEHGIKTEIIHNASIMTAIGETGLQPYKFGKTASIPFPKKGFMPISHYDALKLNKANNLHTLFLLDIDEENPEAPGGKYMSVAEAVKNLLSIEKIKKENIFDEQTLCVGCARLGRKNQVIMPGTAAELLDYDFGKPLHCLIVPAELHFMEEEMLNMWKKNLQQK